MSNHIGLTARKKKKENTIFILNLLTPANSCKHLDKEVALFSDFKHEEFHEDEFKAPPDFNFDVKDSKDLVVLAMAEPNISSRVSTSPVFTNLLTKTSSPVMTKILMFLYIFSST